MAQLVLFDTGSGTPTEYPGRIFCSACLSRSGGVDLPGYSVEVGEGGSPAGSMTQEAAEGLAAADPAAGDQ